MGLDFLGKMKGEKDKQFRSARIFPKLVFGYLHIATFQHEFGAHFSRHIQRQFFFDGFKRKFIGFLLKRKQGGDFFEGRDALKCRLT